MPGTAATLCKTLADAGISVDTIVQSERTLPEGGRTIGFTLNKNDRKGADIALNGLMKKWKNAKLNDGAAITRISAVGAGMPYTLGTAAKIFRAIAEKNINIEMIATSEIRTTCIVAKDDGLDALKAIHNCFGLHQIL